VVLSLKYNLWSVSSPIGNTGSLDELPAALTYSQNTVKDSCGVHGVLSSVLSFNKASIFDSMTGELKTKAVLYKIEMVLN